MAAFQAAVHRGLRLGVVATVIGALAGCALVTANKPTASEPLSAIAPRNLAREAARRATPACKSRLAEQLTTGRRESGECDAVTSNAARAVVFSHGVRFGVVDHRSVDLSSVRMRLSEAVLCRGWPLPSEGDVLRLPDIDAAACLLRPYRGSVGLWAIGPDGARVEIETLQADDDGYLGFEFAAVDMALREHDIAGLDAVQWLEVGKSAWAGTVDLVRLREFLADWHYAWVAKGRGSAALWARRHGDHPHFSDGQALAVEGRIQRQEQDFQAVTHGDLPANMFLQRHVWSPFRRAVEAMASGAPSRPADPAGSARSAP